MKRPDGPRKRPKLKTRARSLAQQRRRNTLDANAAWLPQLQDLAPMTRRNVKNP